MSIPYDALKGDIMTTSEIIERLNEVANVGIVNAKQDTEMLLEAADRLYELREKLDPRWNEWLIMDEGLFLESVDQSGETNWTDNKDGAVYFDNRERAEKFISEKLVYCGWPVLRGDVDAGGMTIFFNGVG